jgi:hypothetical protein
MRGDLMGFSGNIGELDRIASDIRRKGNSARQIAKAAAEALRPEQQAQIAALRTPYGEPWAPLVDGGTADPGIGSRVTLGAVGTQIRTAADGYANFHQSGTRKMVSRELIPTESQGIPPSWSKAIDAAADQVMGERGRP